jgi:hypothetical protein
VSNARVVIVIALVVVFVAAGAYLIFGVNHHTPQNLIFNVTVTGATSMQPSTLNAHLNDTVTINVTSDMDGEVHLHDYDIPFDARAGQVVSHTFKADRTCSCDIEWESTSHGLGTLVVSP